MADDSQIPYRLALAGGWIDQPFVSRLNPDPPGSMVVVAIHNTHDFMDRAGLGTGTRRAAARLWGGRIPTVDRPERRMELVRELYAEENRDQPDPSGSQDMVGLIYPGVCRLDYDAAHKGGVFPRHIEVCTDAAVASWVERSIHILPVAARPEGYNPLGERRLSPEWVSRLGKTGRDCFDAIVARDLAGLGESMNRCMTCWETLLPHVVRHPALQIDLPALLARYQAKYPGAMFSGCGGGYLYVASDHPVPGAFNIKVRLG